MSSVLVLSAHSMYGSPQVSVMVAPQQVLVETPFEIVVSISNTTSKERHVSLRFEDSPEQTNGIVFDGVSGRVPCYPVLSALPNVSPARASEQFSTP